jgi:hypothetical protein
VTPAVATASPWAGACAAACGELAGGRRQAVGVCSPQTARRRKVQQRCHAEQRASLALTSAP